MKVYQPQLRIRLIKARGRSAIGGQFTASKRMQAQRVIDLTGLLDHDSGLRTQRSLYDPAGSFQLSLQNRPVPGFNDNAYGLIEPMDFIEIRGTREPTFGRPPLLMRGFVSQVTEVDQMGEGGQPSRRVIVAGRDVGYVLQLMRPRYRAFGVDEALAQNLTQRFGIPFGQPSLAAFEPFADFTGSAPAHRTPAQFVDGVLQALVNPYLAKLFGDEPFASELRSMRSEVSIVDGVVPPQQGSAAFDGRSVHEILSGLLDVGAFNELFVRDDDDAGLVLVARPSARLDADGKFIGGATAPDRNLPRGEVIAQNFTRSDAGVANYYWVQRGADLINDATRRLNGASGADQSSYLLADEENSSPGTFGWRLMEQQVNMTNAGAAIASPTVAQLGQRAASEEEWLTGRRKLLIAHNRDNVVLESGSLRVMGRHEYRVGERLSIDRVTSVWSAYVVGVSHELSTRGGFVTTLQVERCNGWLDRAANNGTPWLDGRDEGGVR